MDHASPATSAAAPAPASLRHPTKLFVEVTTRCNLRCRMCVRESPGRPIAEGDLTRETFMRLAPAFPRLGALVLNGAGEPLLHPELEHFIACAKRAMPASGWVGFQTNGQLLDGERARALAEAGVDRICLSADAASPELFRELRGGGRQDRLEAAAAALHEAGRRRGRPIAVGFEFVAMRDNLHQLPAMVDWAARNHLSFAIVTHLVAHDDRMAGAAAFEPASDVALHMHREWKERARADGVDLGHYLEAAMMAEFASPDTRRVMAYAQEMIADASRRGVWILDQLLKSDGDLALRRQVEEAFAATEALARREGIDLRLPAVSPRRARRCDFVEEGGAFVSWDGHLHPCAFLWHRYRFHAGSHVKQVAPRSFGDLARADVLSLWNGPDARAFREAVLRYDYPFCHDCAVALCQLQEQEEFDQDCQLSTVPCGACLWPTGVYQCLR